MKKIPIGVQTFSEIINGDYLYLDKTEQIIELLDQDKYVFLSRPRRFGKSLLIDTIRELVTGNKKLFKGTFAYDNWNFKSISPVIYLSFADKTGAEIGDIFYTSFIQYNDTYINYSEFCSKYGINRNYLSLVIRKLYDLTGLQVVVLVDEYDKYVLNNIEDNTWLDYFSDFYGGIKDSDKYIKFFMLTGLNKVLKLSLFSTLNNLNDISYKSKYSDIVGYTENDLNEYFGINIDNYLPEVKEYYNGYKFGGKVDIYNPWGLNSYVANDYIPGLYWSSTGLPSAITDYVYNDGKDILIEILEGVLNGDNPMYNPDISYLIKENINTKPYIYALLVNSGYLTLEKQGTRFKIIVPNIETTVILTEYLISLSARRYKKDGLMSARGQDALYNGIISGNKSDILFALNELNASILDLIPYDWTSKNPEGIFKSILLTQLVSVGCQVFSEGQTQEGRYDMIISNGKGGIIIEAKINDSKTGLNQIKDRYKSYITNGTIIMSINWNRRNKKENKFDVMIEHY